MNNVDLLERHYNAFQNLNTPRDFFIGMSDYFEFIDSVPEFEAIVDKLISQGQDKVKKLEVLSNKAVSRLEKIRIKIEKYIVKNRIKNEVIVKILEDYIGWKNGKIQGSIGIPSALHNCLVNVLKELKKFSEHANFTNQFGESINNRLISFDEINEYWEFKAEIDRDLEMALWGQINELSKLYDVVKQGRKKLEKLLVKCRQKDSTEVVWKMLNYRILVEEWVSIEEGSCSKIYFFNIKKANFWITRFHNYLMTQIVKNSENNSNNKSQSKLIPETKLIFYPTEGRTEYKGVLKIFKAGTKARELLNYLYNSKNTPLELGYIQEGCNSKITIEKYKFKEEKDILDTVRSIKNNLKVKKGEYFPIVKRGKCFIWEQK